jgi:hypothetical protein
MCKAENLTAICEPIVQKVWELRLLITIWVSVAYYKYRFTFVRVPGYRSRGAVFDSRRFQISDVTKFSE